MTALAFSAARVARSAVAAALLAAAGHRPTTPPTTPRPFRCCAPQVDLHLLQWEGLVRERFPRLCQHHARVAALEAIADYLGSESRHRLIWLPEWRAAQEQARA